MGAAAVPIVVTLAGAAMQYVASEGAAKRRNSLISAAGNDRAAYGAKSRALTEDLAKQYDPNTRSQVIQDLAGNRESTITGDVAKADAALPANGYTGKVSNAFSATKASSDASEAQRRVDLTKMLSKVLAPTDARVEEGIKGANTAGLQSTLNSNLQGMTSARNYDIQSVHADPLLTLGGSVLQGVGTGMAASDYSKKLNAIYDGMFSGAKVPGKVPMNALGGDV